MLKFVIDEDMPRSTGAVLKRNGYDVLDVRDCGLRGKIDEEIFRFAQKRKPSF
jgi:predicted nuclease of predicted toxin-antitoxin system